MNQGRDQLHPVEIISFLSAGGNDATPPWWGVPVVAGAFLIAGTVLGFFFNRAADRRKFTREDKKQWQSDTRLLAARLLTASDSIELSVREYSNWDGYDDETPWRDGEDSDRYMEAMFFAYTELSIVAPASVKKGARNLYNAARNCWFADRQDVSGSLFVLTESSASFLAVLRHELGVEILDEAELATSLVYKGKNIPDGTTGPYPS